MMSSWTVRILFWYQSRLAAQTAFYNPTTEFLSGFYCCLVSVLFFHQNSLKIFHLDSLWGLTRSNQSSFVPLKVCRSLLFPSQSVVRSLICEQHQSSSLNHCYTSEDNLTTLLAHCASWENNLRKMDEWVTQGVTSAGETSPTRPLIRKTVRISLSVCCRALKTFLINEWINQRGGRVSLEALLRGWGGAIWGW